MRARVSGSACRAVRLPACSIEPPPAEAYIGPGAGFAFVSSFFAILAAFFLAFLKLITWPFRWLVRTIRWRKALRAAASQQVVIVGLDGQDPELTDGFIEGGPAAQLRAAAEQGSYVRLEDLVPRRVAGRLVLLPDRLQSRPHRVFDFLVPNRKSYLPELCSAKVTAHRRTLKLGKYRFPLGKPAIDLGRKSQSFWKILGDTGSSAR